MESIGPQFQGRKTRGNDSMTRKTPRGSHVGLCFLQYDELVCDLTSKNVEWATSCDETRAQFRCDAPVSSSEDGSAVTGATIQALMSRWDPNRGTLFRALLHCYFRISLPRLIFAGFHSWIGWGMPCLGPIHVRVWCDSTSFDRR